MPAWDEDYSKQLSDMLSPYQSAAQRLNQPYPMLGGSGGSFGVNHPLLARGLNSAMMNVAMTPEPQGPEGAGGGISRAMQGILGANQYQRQMALQSAMLPYQMLQPKLQALDTIAQISQRQSEVPYRRAMEERAMAQSDYYTKRAGALDQSKAVTGDKRIDDNGNVWHGIMDPAKGYRYQNPVTQKFADELPADQQPSFSNEKKAISASRLNEDYTQAGIQRRMAQGDPSAQADWARYIKGVGGIAGSRAGATKEADQPYVDETAMVAREKGMMYDDIKDSKGQLLTDPKNKMLEDMKTLPGMENNPMVRDYSQKVQEFKNAKVQRDQEFERYAASTAPSQGITRAEYSANKDKYPPKNSNRSDLPSGTTRPTTPAASSNSGSAWSPKP